MPANGEIDEKAGSQFNLLARDMFTQKAIPRQNTGKWPKIATLNTYCESSIVMRSHQRLHLSTCLITEQCRKGCLCDPGTSADNLLLDNPPLLHHDDLIRMANGGQPVSDHDDRHAPFSCSNAS